MPPRQGDDLTKEGLKRFAESFPFFNLIGLEILDAKPGWSKTQVTWREDLCQPAGILHGGVMSALIDTGIAHALLLTDAFAEIAKDGGSLVSIDLRVKFLRPVSQGKIICESTIPRLGRHIIHAESIVRNEEDKEVARGDAIYMAVHPDRLKKKSD